MRATGRCVFVFVGRLHLPNSSHMFGVTSGRSVSSFTLFCCSCGFSFGFSCGFSVNRSRPSARRCRGCLFLARDPDVAAWARPLFGNRCKSDPATGPWCRP